VDKKAGKSAVQNPVSRDKQTEPDYTFIDAGASRNFVLALDEVWVRKIGEAGRVVAVDAASSQELEQIVLAMDARGGEDAYPVLYEEGRERNEHTRRVLTSSLSLKLADPSLVSAVAAASGVATYRTPDYAADLAFFDTSGGLAALRLAENLRRLEGVVWVEPQLARLHAKRQAWPPNDALFANQWHLRNTGQSNGVAGIDVGINVTNAAIITNGSSITNTNNPVWSVYRGTDVHIAITDDGLQTTHPDLATNVDTAIDYDFNSGDSDPNPLAGDDHGTACAGVAAARGNNGIGVSGVAPEARLVGLRLISSIATPEQEAQAMNWSNTIIDINSNSWGPTDDGDTLEGPSSTALAGLTNAIFNGRGGRGLIFTWAGGNGLQEKDDSNFDGWANSIYTIAVGAADIRGQQAWYSEPGANLVVCAPSSGDNNAASEVGITTTDRTGSNGYSTTDYANDFGGTSSATPKVAGVVALMLQANPNLGWRDVQEILIRTARRNAPGDGDWRQNGAGFWFNHKFGAGLVNARAAVDMALGWSNLAAQITRTATGSGNGLAIPDNNATGAVHQFVINPADNIRIEHVRVSVDITHPRRRDLRLELTSPSGTVSVLTTQAAGTAFTGANLVWTLMSVRHWGENAAGTWTLRVADRLSGASTGTRVSNTPTLQVYGTSTVPVNPPPAVTLTAPASDAVVSPGATVNLAATATDSTAAGSAGSVTSVEFVANGTVIHTDTTAPYAFEWLPVIGNYAVAARATDSEGASSTSSSVIVEVRNQAPTVAAAQITPADDAYSDTALQVVGVAANDAEGDPVTLSYQWQSSSNGAVWTDAGGASATLAADAANAGRLWRCAVRASDGNSTGEPFFTAPVSVGNRPVTSGAVGSAYSFQPAIYVPAVSANFTRPVIINEFSQGSNGGEWVELLVLQNTSLAYYDISDSGVDYLLFLDDPVWDNIPAGTVIVVYNGATKDPLLPAEDTNPLDDGRMVLSSRNAAYFAQTTSWPALGNSGDAIFVNDADNNTVAQVAYGNSLVVPNVGTVNSGRAAYYTGGAEEGITDRANWFVTSASTARGTRAVSRAPGDLFFSEYVEGTSNNKAVEIYNPSSAAVNLSTAGYVVQNYANGTNAPTASIALTGTIQPGAVHVLAHASASAALTALANQTNGNLTFNGDDAVVLRKNGANGTIVDVVGQIGFDPGTQWSGNGVSTLDRTLRRKSSVNQGDINGTNAFDPSLEWDGFPIDTFSGLGTHSVGASLSVTAVPATFAETAGTNASTGTVSLPAAVSSNVTVAVAVNNSTVTAPASLTITAGATNATFPIGAVDNAASDGTRIVTITATAPGYSSATVQVTVTDDEPSFDGVTPGKGNNPVNADFVANLRAGTFGQGNLYRTGTGHQMPPGLSLDAATGLLSGTPTQAGTYNIVLESYNALGETGTQTFVLAIGGGSMPTFTEWLGSYPGLADPASGADPDADGLPNLVEYFLGLSPAESAGSGEAMVLDAAQPGEVRMDYRRSKLLDGVTGGVAWRNDLSAGAWSTEGVTETVVSDHGMYEIRRATVPLVPGETRKFLRLEVEQE